MNPGRFCIVALALAVLTLPTAASAQVLTLEQVRESASEFHPTIGATLERLEAARGDLLAARGAFDPLLDAKGKGQAGGYYTLGRADAELLQPTTLWGTEFWVGYRYGQGLDDRFPTYYDDETGQIGEVRGGLAVPILRDGIWDKRRANIAIAEAGVDAAEQKAGEARLKIVEQATDAYMTWVAAHQNLLVADELLELARTRVEWVAAQVEAGAIPAVEKLEAQRSLLSREKSRISAQRAVEASAYRLAIFARDERGMPLDITTSEPPADLVLPSAPPSRSNKLEEDVLACHPLLEGARAKVEQARAKQRLADVNLLPELDVMAQVSRDLGQAQEELQGTVWETGLVFSFPLLNRTARGMQSAAEAEVAASVMELQLREQALRLDLRDAYSAYMAASERYDISTDLLSNSRDLAEAERKRFRQGANTLFIVNLREEAIGAATLDQVDAARKTWAAWAKVDALTACVRMK